MELSTGNCLEEKNKTGARIDFILKFLKMAQAKPFLCIGTLLTLHNGPITVRSNVDY